MGILILSNPLCLSFFAAAFICLVLVYFLRWKIVLSLLGMALGTTAVLLSFLAGASLSEIVFYLLFLLLAILFALWGKRRKQ